MELDGKTLHPASPLKSVFSVFGVQKREREEILGQRMRKINLESSTQILILRTPHQPHRYINEQLLNSLNPRIISKKDKDNVNGIKRYTQIQ